MTASSSSSSKQQCCQCGKGRDRGRCLQPARAASARKRSNVGSGFVREFSGDASTTGLFKNTAAAAEVAESLRTRRFLFLLLVVVLAVCTVFVLHGLGRRRWT